MQTLGSKFFGDAPCRAHYGLSGCFNKTDWIQVKCTVLWQAPAPQTAVKIYYAFDGQKRRYKPLTNDDTIRPAAQHRAGNTTSITERERAPD